jgi:hypothetical protein
VRRAQGKELSTLACSDELDRYWNDDGERHGGARLGHRRHHRQRRQSKGKTEGTRGGAHLAAQERPAVGLGAADVGGDGISPELP